MPIYEFKCMKCGEIKEIIVSSGSSGDASVVCEACGCEDMARVMSVTNYAVGGKQGQKARTQISQKSCGPGNTCATIDIPGPAR